MVMLVLLFFQWIGVPASISRGADQIPATVKVSVLKVTNLYLTTRYIRWPDDGPNVRDPFVIGVFGEDSLEGNLDRLIKRSVRDRPIQIRRFRTVEDVQTCHILYIESSVTSEQISKLLEVTLDKPVVVWRDENRPEWPSTGCCFIHEEDRLLIEVDPIDLKRRGLVVEGQFLSLNTVRTPKKTSANLVKQNTKRM